MRKTATLLLACTLITAGAVTAASRATAADVSTHAPLVLAPESLRYCVTCHGVELQGNRLVDAPRLAGLPRWYLERQLEAFRAGWRGTHAGDRNGMEMRPQAAVLEAPAVDQAVDFATSVPVRNPPPVSVTGDTARGQALYATCAACHGVDGEGIEAQGGPPLAGQNDWYLVTQLNSFRSGARGTAAGDDAGATMAASVAVLADEAAVNDVVAWITTLVRARGAPGGAQAPH